jgi:hypothetical protein
MDSFVDKDLILKYKILKLLLYIDNIIVMLNIKLLKIHLIL